MKRRRLLLEEVVEGFAGVGRARRGGIGGGLRRGNGGRSGVLFDGHADREKGAVVAGVFGKDALGDGLGTLEAGTGVEIHALLTGVQLDAATGAFALGVEAGE